MKSSLQHPACAAYACLAVALLLADHLPALDAEEDNILTPAEAADGWKLLFNGKDLAGWKGAADKWSVENGAITNTATEKKPASEGQTLVWQGGEIADFELAYKARVQPIEGEKPPGMGGFFCFRSLANSEFGQAVTPGPFSGWFREGASRSYKGYPWSKKTKLSDSGDPKKPTNEDLGMAGDRMAMQNAFAIGDWNDQRIIALGNSIRGFAGGKEVCDLLDETSNAPKKGLLHLRIYSFAHCVLQFKNIKLKRLTAGSSSPAAANTTPARSEPAPSEPALTGPGQLKSLSDQFPAAKEWALARLDSPVPGVIADEIAKLKAALADESGLNAQDREAQNAYKIGIGLCDALIFTFKTRAQAYQQAGGTAIHAPGAEAIQQWDRAAKSYDEQLNVAYTKFAVSLVARGARQSIIPPNPPLIVIPKLFTMPAVQAIPPLPLPSDTPTGVTPPTGATPPPKTTPSPIGGN